MTLKEKLRHSLTGHLSDEKTEVDVNVAATIAEEFAINFANWYEFTLRESDNLNERFTPKQLIEMFKIEKRL
jgi:hypothetical protein